MNEEDFKNILEEALNPIRKDINTLKTDLSGVKTDLSGVKTDLKEVKKTQAKHTDILEKHTDILENRVLPSVTYTENTLKVYSDMYKMNNDNMKRLEKRMETLEEDSGVEVPEELTLKELPAI